MLEHSGGNSVDARIEHRPRHRGLDTFWWEIRLVGRDAVEERRRQMLRVGQRDHALAQHGHEAASRLQAGSRKMEFERVHQVLGVHAPDVHAVEVVKTSGVEDGRGRVDPVQGEPLDQLLQGEHLVLGSR